MPASYGVISSERLEPRDTFNDDPYQCGFVPGKSTTYQISLSLKIAIRTTLTTFIDFCKAYNTPTWEERPFHIQYDQREKIRLWQILHTRVNQVDKLQLENNTSPKISVRIMLKSQKENYILLLYKTTVEFLKSIRNLCFAKFWWKNTNS